MLHYFLNLLCYADEELPSRSEWRRYLNHFFISYDDDLCSSLGKVTPTTSGIEPLLSTTQPHSLQGLIQWSHFSSVLTLNYTQYIRIQCSLGAFACRSIVSKMNNHTLYQVRIIPHSAFIRKIRPSYSLCQYYIVSQAPLYRSLQGKSNHRYPVPTVSAYLRVKDFSAQNREV